MTVKEVQEKQVRLEAEMSTALEAAKVLTPATEEYDDAYARYLGAKSGISKIPDEIAAAKLAENADAIKLGGAQMSEAITQLIAGIKVGEASIESLLGKPVTALRWFTDSEGKASAVFNPTVAVRGTTGNKGASKSRVSIVDATGNKMNSTKFVLAHLTEAQKTESHTDYVKYPHTLVDSKPKFDEFCTSHSLTGFTYEARSKAEESAAS